MRIGSLWREARWLNPTNHSVFLALWLLVIGVSVHDGYLVLTSRGVIASEERNPLGQWLLGLNGGDVWLLLAAKAAGTLVVATVLWLLFWKNRPVGAIVCGTLATLQLALLLWLYLA